MILNGIRVVDFGRFIAGPYAATILGDLGAEVIRVESPDGGEDRYKIPVVETGEGANFLQLGRGKKSLTLDTSRPEGRAIMLRLVRTADIVVANVPPDALKAMSLDYETLCAEKPDIILATASAFGSTGPYRARNGFDAVAQCMSGATYLTGPEEMPVRAQAAYCDYGTALYLTVGILAALRERDQTGKGQQVEASLLHTGLAFVGHFLTEQAMTKVNRTRTANRGQTSGPVDVYKTRDGWFAIFSLGDKQFRRIARLVGHQDWIDDASFSDDMKRGANGARLSAGVAAWCADLTNQQALDAMAGIHIPCGPVLSPQQVLDDEHVKASRYFKPLAFPGASAPVPIVDLPLRFSATVTRPVESAALLGENTDDILRGIGLDNSEIDELRRKKLV